MRLTVDHKRTYRIVRPGRRLVQMLRMTPDDCHSQTIADWQIHVDCDAQLKEGLDGFGNKVTMLYADGPIETIEIALTGEILTGTAENGAIDCAIEPFPPALYLRPTALTKSSEEIRAFAEGVDAGPAALSRAVAERFIADPTNRTSKRSAAEAFGADDLTSRDVAHIFLAAAHARSISARFVSGFRLIDGEETPIPHNWVEAHVSDTGWMAFDPSRGGAPGEEYVRVATGLDALMAAPVAGERMTLVGEGEKEEDAADA